MISEKHKNVLGLGVTYEGVDIPSLSVTKLAVWNAGTEALRTQDIASTDPLLVTTRGDNVKLLKVTVRETTQPANASLVQHETRNGNEAARLTFEYLNPGDGILMDVVHTGTGTEDIELRGSLVGAIIKRTAADPETQTTYAGGPGAAVPVVSIESGRERARAYGYSSLGMATLTVLATWLGAYFEFRDWRAIPVFSVVFLALGLSSLAYAARTYPPSRIRKFDGDL